MATACSSEDEGGQGTGGAMSGPAYVLADGVSITAVDFYQTVKRPLFPENTAATSSVPIVPLKESLLRIHYSTDASFNGKPVLLQLQLDEHEPLLVQAQLAGASDEAKLSSTINVAIPGSQVGPGEHRYAVEILQATALSSGDNLSARHPSQDRATFFAEGKGDPLRIVFVPIAYGGDGSGRLPDTSEEQLERFRQRFVQLYPTHELQITVDPPLDWAGALQPNIAGWEELLQRLVDYRKSANAPDNLYYYGLFRPRETFASYCSSGCVTGLSLLGSDPGAAFARVGMGMGYSGDASPNTAVHEVGHMHGLKHAPCNTSTSLDPNYPHAEASIGVLGYDQQSQALVSPDDHKDFMSYCQPEWSSDYNYLKLFQRHLLLSSSASKGGAPIRYRRFGVNAAGQLRQLGPLRLSLAGSGAIRKIVLRRANGSSEIAHARWFPYSHGNGGMLLLPEAKWPGHPGLRAVLASHAHKKAIGDAEKADKKTKQIN